MQTNENKTWLADFGLDSNIMVRADNIYMMASGLQHAGRIVRRLAEIFYEAGLFFKQIGACMVVNEYVEAEDWTPLLIEAPSALEVERREAIEILGSRVDAVGSSQIAAEHRCAALTRLWHCHRTYWYCRRRPLQERLNIDLPRSWLQCSGTEEDGPSHRAFCRHFIAWSTVRRILQIRLDEGKGWYDYWTRVGVEVAGRRQEVGADVLVAKCIRMHFRWMGHVSRQPEHFPVKALLGW